jgi:hypothetical protein
VKCSVHPRTYANYRLQVDKHISSVLGCIKLKWLTAANIQSFYNAKPDSGLPSPAYTTSIPYCASTESGRKVEERVAVVVAHLLQRFATKLNHNTTSTYTRGLL